MSYGKKKKDDRFLGKNIYVNDEYMIKFLERYAEALQPLALNVINNPYTTLTDMSEAKSTATKIRRQLFADEPESKFGFADLYNSIMPFVHGGFEESLVYETKSIPHIWARVEYILNQGMVTSDVARAFHIRDLYWTKFLEGHDTIFHVWNNMFQNIYTNANNSLEQVYNQANHSMIRRTEKIKLKEQMVIAKQQQFLKENPAWGLW